MSAGASCGCAAPEACACKPSARALRRRPRRNRYEYASVGFDDFKQSLGTGYGGATAIRIPELAAGVPYLVLCQTIDLLPGEAIVGCREGVEFGAPCGLNDDDEFLPWSTTPPLQMYKRDVVTPGWCLPDAFWTFSLCASPMPWSSRYLQGPLDQESFIWNDAGGPCLLYDTAVIPSPVTATAPGYLGLTRYTPPARQGYLLWEHRGIQWPWSRETAQSGLDVFTYPVDVPTRFWLYCQVLQGDKDRTIVELPSSFASSTFSPEAFAPEDLLLNLIPESLVISVRAALTVETRR